MARPKDDGRIVKSVGVSPTKHPHLYRAITEGNLTTAEFPNASHFMAQAAEEKLKMREANYISNGDLLEELRVLRDLITNLRAIGTPDVKDKINEAKSKMKLTRGRRDRSSK